MKIHVLISGLVVNVLFLNGISLCGSEVEVFVSDGTATTSVKHDDRSEYYSAKCFTEKSEAFPAVCVQWEGDKPASFASVRSILVSSSFVNFMDKQADGSFTCNVQYRRDQLKATLLAVDRIRGIALLSTSENGIEFANLWDREVQTIIDDCGIKAKVVDVSRLCRIVSYERHKALSELRKKKSVK